MAQDLAAPEVVTDISRVFDLGSSGGSDVGRDKDRMIGDALTAEGRRPTRS